MRLVRRHDPVQVMINVIHPDALLPTYGTDHSAGFDLAPIEPVRLFSGESILAPLGLIIKAPADHMLMIAPRSSTFKKWGVTLANTVGIVDEDYCGPDDELKLFLHNPGDKRVDIPAGTRLAQGIFVPVTRAEFIPVNGALAKSRGGWGSTGEREFKRHAGEDG